MSYCTRPSSQDIHELYLVALKKRAALECQGFVPLLTKRNNYTDISRRSKHSLFEMFYMLCKE